MRLKVKCSWVFEHGMWRLMPYRYTHYGLFFASIIKTSKNLYRVTVLNVSYGNYDSLKEAKKKVKQVLADNNYKVL